MKKQSRSLTEKYKIIRLRPDHFYSSRLFQTVFNKFIRKGKKAVSQKLLFVSLSAIRYVIRRPCIFNYLLQILQSLRAQFILLPRRKAKKILNVPVPVRRNKRDLISVHTLYVSILKRKERLFYKNINSELLSLTIDQAASSTIRGLSNDKYQVFEERVNMDLR